MSREHPLAPHRLVLVAVAAVLGLVALLALEGPGFVQRAYRPLHHQERIAVAAASNDLDPYLVAAVVNVESGFDEREVSRRGAVGLMQIKPETAEEVRDHVRQPSKVTAETLKDPAENLEYGTRYLGKLMERYDGDIVAALAAYNAGPSNADRWREGDVPSSASDEASEGAGLIESIGFPETQRYVRAVLKQREDYERLYPGAFPARDTEGAK